LKREEKKKTLYNSFAQKVIVQHLTQAEYITPSYAVETVFMWRKTFSVLRMTRNFIASVSVSSYRENFKLHHYDAKHCIIFTSP